MKVQNMEQQRFDIGSLSDVERTPQGGLRVKAHLTRAGVFEYETTEGKSIREYRPPEEVFAAESLATLSDAPITVEHPGMVTMRSLVGGERVVSDGDHPHGRVEPAAFEQRAAPAHSDELLIADLDDVGHHRQIELVIRTRHDLRHIRHRVFG
jgi:hypothetical protein